MTGEDLAVAFMVVLALTMLVCFWPPWPRETRTETDAEVYGVAAECDCPNADYCRVTNCKGRVPARADDPEHWGSE